MREGVGWLLKDSSNVSAVVVFMVSALLENIKGFNAVPKIRVRYLPWFQLNGSGSFSQGTKGKNKQFLCNDG